MKKAISVINECRAPALRWRSRVCFCFLPKIIFKLTIDISMRKIILEMEYFIKSMIYQILNFSKTGNSFSLSRDDPKTFILL